MCQTMKDLQNEMAFVFHGKLVPQDHLRPPEDRGRYLPSYRGLVAFDKVNLIKL